MSEQRKPRVYMDVNKSRAKGATWEQKTAWTKTLRGQYDFVDTIEDLHENDLIITDISYWFALCNARAERPQYMIKAACLKLGMDPPESCADEDGPVAQEMT